ncbi:flagellar biosynthetic protein FliO [Alkalicoccus daliensis]|uniref:Flagellar protein FliO/FliZ n=1 Tax=Alkalicoccus daliensis TaxID=745820 RepID=A0A1H0A586_9BACI|nr:flagellar biosynthetic protein FliO [Alkalicoccus daliensis]SDN28421.1 flagellar protein FliO/FliZ [Alkalicoccus daliensis]
MRIVIYSILLLFLFSFTAYAEDDSYGESDRSVIEGLGEENSPEEEGTFFFDENETEEENEAVVGGDQGPNLIGLTLQLILALGVVLFLIYGLLKFMNKRARSFSSHQTVQSVGGVGIGTNKSVQLVRVGEKLLVLGVGDSVSLLKEIDDPQEVEKMLQAEQQTELIKPKQALEAWFSNRKNKENPYADNDKNRFQSLLSKEMTDVKKSQEKVHSTLEEKDR